MTTAALHHSEIAHHAGARAHRPRRGRPETSTIQRERDRHVLAAVMLYIKRFAVEDVMDVLDCSRSCAYAWAAKAARYPEYLAEKAKARALAN